MVEYTGINHLEMVTGDMDMTIRYWRDLLGMRLVAGLGRKGYRHYFFDISGGRNHFGVTPGVTLTLSGNGNKIAFYLHLGF